MIWLAGFLLCWVLLFILRRKIPTLDAFLTRISGRPFGKPEDGSSKAWVVGVFLFLVLALTTLEVLQPYYFSQDDALATEMPGMLVGCRSVWKGQFPDFSPYTLMGTPLASVGGDSLTYPPTYLAYFIARNLLGNEYALMEVFAFLHLLAGFWLVWWLARREEFGQMTSALVSLTFVLSGAVLIMGRSWHMTMGIVVWAPVLLLCVQSLRKGPVSWKWMLITGASLGVYYQVGFSQVWAYAALFFGVAVLWLVATGDIPLRRLRWVIPAFLLGSALSLPLFMTQFAATRDMAHKGGYGNGVLVGMKSFFLPFPVKSFHPNLWGSTNFRFMGEFYYFGTLFMILWVLGLLLILSRRPGREALAGSVWSACALLAFLLALGPDGGLWQIISALPVARQMNNHPFRVLPFFVLFAVLAGGGVLEGFLSVLKNRRRWECAIGFTALALLGYHACVARPAFYSYGFKPYPPLPPALNKLLRESGKPFKGRILPIAPPRSIEPNFADSLALSLPAVYGICSFDGYDPLTESRPAVMIARSRLINHPARALKAYGVRWIIVHRTAVAPTFSPNPFERGLEGIPRWGFLLRALPTLAAKKVLELPDEQVWEMREYDPEAFPVGHTDMPLPVKTTGRGLEVSLPESHPMEFVIVNFLWYPGTRAWADGTKVPCGRDSWDRIVVEAPRDAKRIEVDLCGKWGPGLREGTMVFVLALLVTVWLCLKKGSGSGAVTSTTEKA